MSKLEKEIKVLDINVDQIKDKLDRLGAKYKGEKNQKIYVYDVPTLYYRYLEIRDLLNSDNALIVQTNLSKLKTLMTEFLDLITEEDLNKLLKEINLDDLSNLVELPIDEIRYKIKNEVLNDLFKTLMINPNKWVRLRQSNEKIELTTKHVFDKNDHNIQKVIESEIEVSSLEDTNKILESIGIHKRSYQEKIRTSYKYKTADIEIDIWPMLKPYMEIECDEEEIIDEIIEILDLKDKEIVSVNTETLYKQIGVNIHEISELKFEDRE